jgi:hypothetical protein
MVILTEILLASVVSFLIFLVCVGLVNEQVIEELYASPKYASNGLNVRSPFYYMKILWNSRTYQKMYQISWTLTKYIFRTQEYDSLLSSGYRAEGIFSDVRKPKLKLTINFILCRD